MGLLDKLLGDDEGDGKAEEPWWKSWEPKTKESEGKDGVKEWLDDGWKFPFDSKNL